MVGRTISSQVGPHAAPSEAAQQVATWRLRSGARSRPLLCSLFTITERHGGGGGGGGGGEGINPHSGVNPRLGHFRRGAARVRRHDCFRLAVTAASHPKHLFFSPPRSLSLSLLSLFLSPVPFPFHTDKPEPTCDL